MAEHFFLITIGPVQEFIAAARRTRDLWAGSQLLSELSRFAARELRHRHNANLIFPAQQDLDAHDVVNRIIAKLPEGADPQAVGKSLEGELRAELARLVGEVFDNKERISWPEDPGYRQRAEQQVDALIELAWAAAPLDTSLFQSGRESLEAALAARKHTRGFAQPTWGLPVPKSSIDGVRESVIDDAEYADDHDPAPFRTKAERLFRLYGAGRAERLSGVDLFKRHYRATESRADFPSTSHFAALPLLWRTHAANKDIRYGLSRYLDKLKSAYEKQNGERRLTMLRLAPRFETPVTLYNYDASILFASRLEEELEGQALKDARDALATYLRESLNGEPEPYYAILLADGDNMGKVIDNQPDLEAQQKLSLALDQFAGGVRGIVESADHRGALVYSGGDDVLAFLPLDTVLTCAQKLHEAYAKEMRGFLSTEGNPSTLSVGIVICHHLEPLTDALNLARKAEQMAKNLPDKDGLTIILSKRSGFETTISGPWSGTFYGRLQRFVELHRHDAIPDGAAYELRDMDERVGQALPSAALIAEALRILKRKRAQHGTQVVGPEDQALIESALRAGSARLGGDGRPLWGLDELADELIVAREFARTLGPLAMEEGGPRVRAG